LNVTIRAAGAQDDPALWAILEPIVRAGETYTLPQDLTAAETVAFWRAPAHEVFVAEADGTVVGTYFLRPNQGGRGAHVANCGYATAAANTGRGVAFAMCEHSLARARERGFRAMQFNFVVSANERAVRLWERCGFTRVGRLPGAFDHPALGYVDALVMYRSL